MGQQVCNILHKKAALVTSGEIDWNWIKKIETWPKIHVKEGIFWKFQENETNAKRWREKSFAWRFRIQASGAWKRA